ncbi:MAG: hypothetical protein RMM29_09840, partial [Planctomycetota bacterium]|nr:hypothetical protein [Planctomycetota bacterium]
MIAAIAPHWTRLDAAARQALLESAAQDARAAQTALMALLPRDGALAPSQIAALAASAARDPLWIVHLITDAAPHWDRLDAAARQALLESAAQDARTARRALTALITIEGALAPDQIAALAASAARDPFASADLIAAIALHWTRLGAAARQALLEAAARYAEAARWALMALLPRDGALAHSQIAALASAIARDAWQSADLITDAAPHWDRLDAAARQALLDSAAQDAETAQTALMALLPRDGALADAHALALARAALPDVAWETINAVARARRAPLAPIIRLALAPAPDQPALHAALRAGWGALDAADQIALARAVAPDMHMAVALARLLTDSDLPLADEARRILARAIIPPAQALAALPHAPDASVMTAWLPVEPPDDAERAAWRQALEAGICRCRSARPSRRRRRPPPAGRARGNALNGAAESCRRERTRSKRLCPHPAKRM